MSLAIVVNGLVNSLTVIKAASRLLETYWAQLPEHDRASMLADITRHADFIAGVLSDVAHELPPLPLDVIDLRLAEAGLDEGDDDDEGVDERHENE
ncbi:MAG TPA: hypothetical protein VFK42_19755 [Acidimicrobiales bacterium]|nr:hypothetical protein [Acidimicrobiales bacterium]